MKRTVAHYAAAILAAMSLTACNMPSQAQGPTTWMDQPLDGVHVPLAPLVIQAHASDADGVASIEFYEAENLLAAVPTGDLRLGEASIQWTPTAAGIYVISVSATDSQGNTGPEASVQISVGDLVMTGTPTPAPAQVLTGTPTPAPASAQCATETLVAPVLLSPADGSTVAPDPVLTWSYPDETCHPYSYKIDVSEDASFVNIGWGFGTLDYNETSREWPLPAGKCYYWRVLAYVPDVYGPASSAWRFCIAGETGPSFTLTQNANCRAGPGTAYDSVDVLMEGQTVPIEGRNSDNTWFWVRKPSGSSHCWVSASVGTASGNWQGVPIVAAPPLPITATSTVDLTPPVISEVTANPTLISVQIQCGATPPTTIISARVTDASGVARVVVRVAGFGEYDMTPIGGGYYQATLGPFSEAGSLSIFVQAQDNAGNAAISPPIEVQIVPCPG